MNQEIKLKLEQAAKEYIKPFTHQLHLGAEEGLIMDLAGFAQTILENPGEWGLYAPDPALAVLAEGYHRLQSENERYRGALESIANTYSSSPGTDGLIEIAEEALKQEDTK